jgi:CelD/BcsL family acetyltransferase involved in cellulose biosynthesis
MEFKRYNTFETLASLKHDWNHLLEKCASQVPFLTYDYLQAWWQTRGGGEWPEESELVLIAAFEGETLVGIAPLFHAEIILGKPALMFVGAIEVSDFLDFIVQPDNLAPFLSGLVDFLLDPNEVPQWELLDLSNILEESPSLVTLQAEAERRGWAHKQVPLQSSPYIPLPGNFDEYLAGIDKKQRHEIRRKLRNVEQSLAEGNFYFVEEKDKLQAETQAFIDMMAQDPSKKEFLTDAMQQHLHNTAQVAFDNGWLQLSFFTLDGEKAAANMSFKFNNRLWLYNSGWEWEYREFSPGWVLLTHLLEWANEHGIEEFDFMRGGEAYKYKFGGIDRHIYRVTLTP